MSYSRFFCYFLILSASNLATNAIAQPTARQDDKFEEQNSTIEILDVAKAESGWGGSRNGKPIEGSWTGALKKFPLSSETLEFRLLFAPSGKRPDWWGQVDISQHYFGALPQTNVLNPVLKAHRLENVAKGIQDFPPKDFDPKNAVSLPIGLAAVRGPVWDESLGLYTATLFMAPERQNNQFWPQKFRYLRFSGRLPDLFGKPESRSGFNFDIECSTQDTDANEHWSARLRNREPHFFLKSVRVQARNPHPLDAAFGRAGTQYEVITTLVGVWPTEIFQYNVDFPQVFNGAGKPVTVPTEAAINDRAIPEARPEPNTPFFVTRRVAFGLDPKVDKEHDSLFFRSHLGWKNSPNVLYPFRVDGKVPIGEVPPSQWRFEAPSEK